MNKKERVGILQKTIKWLEINNKFHISIHDLSGILHNNPILKVDINNKIHNQPFCKIAKSTPVGLRFCLKCKSQSIRKVLKESGTFKGHCYLGVTEIVSPIYWKDKLLCIIYLGIFLEEENKQLIMKKIEKNSKISTVNKDKLYQEMNMLEVVNSEDINKYREIIDILEHHILAAVSNNIINIRKNTKPSSPIYTGTKNWIIESVQLYINEYYNKSLKLSQLADLYFVHPHYLCKLFKKETGENFSRYVNHVRIDNAKKILRITDEKIINIALQVGFNNVTYFNRVFKEFTGMTPGQYRKRKILKV